MQPNIEAARTSDQLVGPQKNVTSKRHPENNTQHDSAASVVRIARPFLSARRRAAILRSELRRLATWRRANGVLLDGEPWGFVLAAALASAEEGPLLFPNRPGRAWWPGLNFPALENEVRICGLTVEADHLSKIFARASEWRAKNPHRKIRGDTVARLLNVVSIERRTLKLTAIGAVDESSEQRAVRRTEEGRAKDRERKKATRGRQPREEYLAKSLSRQKPWEEEGISESTWRRRRKKVVPNEAQHDRSVSEALIIDSVHGHTSVTRSESLSEAVARPERRAADHKAASGGTAPSSSNLQPRMRAAPPKGRPPITPAVSTVGREFLLLRAREMFARSLSGAKRGQLPPNQGLTPSQSQEAGL